MKANDEQNVRCGRKREDTYSALRFGFEFRVFGFVVYYLLSYFAVENGCYGLFWVILGFNNFFVLFPDWAQ